MLSRVARMGERNVVTNVATNVVTNVATNFLMEKHKKTSWII
jgi:hypothetical protein